MAKKALDLGNKLRQASETLLQVVSLGSDVSQAGVPQPPFPHLLRSNTPPTESETCLLRDVITIAEEEGSRLKEMASGSDSFTSNNLTRELGRIHQFIIEHNAILSSIRRIPPEVLENIFIHTLPTTATLGSRVLCTSQLPWVLSQVCHRWRITMLSFSVMWRDFPIVDLEEAHVKKKPYLDLLTELLKRSCNMPIRLTIVNGSKKDTGHPAIGMLVLHSDRWQEIKIKGSSGVLSALKLIQGRLSSLQSLHVHLSSFDIDRVIIFDVAILDLLQIEPQLRHVDFGVPIFNLTFHFPTNQLVHYSIDGPHLEQAIQAMFSSPSLRSLRFLDHHDERIPMVTLWLFNLILLDACFNGNCTMYEPFFNNITTPSLEKLLVKNGLENTITPICSMILRSDSPCLLKVLHLRVKFAPGELQSVLRLTPLVTNLKIAFPPVQDISALIFDGNTPPLVPLLKECDFLRQHASPGNFNLSIETIQAIKLLASSRCESPTSTGTLLSREFHPLQILHLSLESESTRYRQCFERWVDSDMGYELRKLHGRLLDMLPELVRQYIPSTRKFNLTWKNEVTALLTHLENLQVEKASDICMSGIQYILYAISIWFVRFSFSKRILKKWEPILRDDMPNLRSTVFYFKYLSTTQNHDLCSSPDAVKFFYYGLDSNDISPDRYVALYGAIAGCMGLIRTERGL